MNVYETHDIGKLINGNPYVGRGIVLGKSEDGKNAVSAYFIMGRSENSRNRIFVENGDEVIIHPYDASKVEDPSLIIYSPIKVFENNVIVTNGDQTDTIYNFVKGGKTFEEALETREFEPDKPNFTPRISGMITFKNANFSYKMSILKSADENGTACNRYTFNYNALDGIGHFIHTYVTDGNPLPTFMGEPERVVIGTNFTEFVNEIWENLDSCNKIALYARSIDIKTGAVEKIMYNTHEVK